MTSGRLAPRAASADAVAVTPFEIGSLFAGIGGLELGLERALGARVAWQVELDDRCRRVLARHWPEAERHADVRAVGAGVLRRVDLVCGGFPCQDISAAGKGAGLAGARSGLWYEFRRVVGELRPRYVVVENVASGARRWVDSICNGLASLGYRPRPFALSARDVGAPHLRRRVFVVADADGVELREQPGRSEGARRSAEAEPGDDGAAGSLGDADGERRVERGNRQAARPGGGSASRSGPYRWPPLRGDADGWRRWSAEGGAPPAQHRVRRGDDGVSSWVDRARGRRLRALGNAVVPQCAEVIGRVIAEMEASS